MKSNASLLKRIAAVMLVICMLLSSSVTVIAAGLELVGITPEGSSSAGFKDVSGKYNFADRTEGFNDSVQKNAKNPDSPYWVIVQMDGDSVSELHKKSGSKLSLTDFSATAEAAEAAAALEASHDAFFAELNATGISYTGKYSYTLLSNAVAIQVKSKDVETVSGLKGVKKVSYSEHYATPEAVTENNANVWGTGIYKTEGIRYQGQGLVVAVLDTGLDQSHAAFRTMPATGTAALTKNLVAQRIFDGNTHAGLLKFDSNTTVDDVYYNVKVPFAYDYADKDAVVYPSYSVHGTHVAGIIAGNLGDKADEYIKDSDGQPILGKDGKPLTFTGVAPEAQLVICKVFTDKEENDSLGGAETVDILAALEDCVKLGVDVINMSLGSAAGFSEGDDDVMIGVYSSIRANGISLMVAASNDYSSAYGSNTGTNTTDHPDSATVGSPSTFDEAMSVASISGQKSQYMLGNDGSSVIYFNEVSDGNGNRKEFVKELLAAVGKGENETVTLPFVAVQLYGQITGYTGLDVAGKIVLVERGGGGMTFEEKVRIAKMQGALAVIIYNNVSGNINMTIGGVSNIPVCSITMDSSKGLLAGIDSKREGKITISASQLGGPFMSDFSSWGPTPSLNLKPEITAHGGDITSSVPGGWDTLSGTSMATPNMAGAYALVLQYLREKFPTMDKNEQVTLANRLIMSAPVIAYDEFGTPYSPRKQGAGLATIKNAIETQAYLYVDGIDKTKIELGDDKNKTGVYNLTFKLRNMGNGAKTYALSSLIMTETVTEDNSGVRTVAEHAYMLNDLCEIVYTVNGQTAADCKVTVAAGATVEITAKVTLNAQARKYLDDNFENGMYVEGFVCLADEASDGVDLSIPFLGFYGDWYDAPMFDMSRFEEDAAKQDDSIPDEEKPQASVYATVPLGSYYGGRYIVPLGSYLYTIPDYMNKTIYASEDKVSVSMYDTVNHRTAYQLYSIYTGLLRGAKFMDVKITDTVTGEVVYEEQKTNIRKAYSGGSTNAAASNVLLELSPLAMGLASNRKYQFEMKGTMDRVLEQGEYPASRPEDSFSFTFYVDSEAPELVDYRVRFDPYKDGKDTKYKVYLDMDIYDNHYAHSVALCYLNNDELQLELLSGNFIPVEGSRGGTTTVSLDITEYYDSDIDMYIQVDDYALNTRAYQLTEWKTLREAVVYPESITITDGASVTMDMGEARTLNLTVAPEGTATTNLYWTSSDEKVVRVQNGELYAVGTGRATVTVYGAPNTATQNKASIQVVVTDQTSTKPIRMKSLKLDLIRNGSGAMVDPSDLVDVHPNTTYVLKVTADPWYYPGTLDIRFASSAPDVAEVNETTGVVHTLREGTAYISATQYVDGKATAFSVSAKLNVGPEFDVENGILRGYYGLGGKVVIPKSLNVYYIYEEAFKDNNNITELEISAPCMEIQHAAFDSMTALRRVVFPQSVTFVASDAFRNCTALERVDLHTRAITFNHRTFAGCTSLKYINNLVVTDAAVDTKVANILDLNEDQYTRVSPQIGTLGDQAFRGCTALETVDLTQLRVSGTSVFEGCTSLREVILSSHTVLGETMFAECENLATLTFTDANRFDFAAARFAFSGCQVSNLVFANGGSGDYYLGADGCYYTDASCRTLVFASQKITSFTAPSGLKTISVGAFSGNRNLRTVNLGSVETIGAYAFADTGLRYNDRPLTVPASVRSMGEGVFYACPELENARVDAGISELPASTFELTSLSSIALSPSIRRLGDSAFRYTDFKTLDLTDTGVKELGDYVFSYGYKLETVRLPALTKVGSYTFFYAPDPEFASAPEFYPLKSVSFAEGTTDIGTATFYSHSGFPYLTNISLPDSVKNSVTEIGNQTFAGCLALEHLNLGKLTKVGSMAFYRCEKLSGIDTSALTDVGSRAFTDCTSMTFDLSSVRTVGASAFENTVLGEANLASAETVGNRAFYGADLTSVKNLTKVRTVGDYAFAGTKLSGTFTLPATVRAACGALGVGMFIDTQVSAIALNGENSVYSVKGGVLFSKLDNGMLQLEICPPALEGEEYTVPVGTARIQDGAFRSVKNLKKIQLPGSVAAIGDKAFYQCSATHYDFLGLTAPILETYLADVFENDAQRSIFSWVSGADRTHRDSKGEEKYYANFSDYAALVLYPELSGVDTLGLTLSYPANATGFNIRIWNLFFETSEPTQIIAEPDTEKAMEAIGKMPSIADIEAVKSMSDKTAAAALLASYKELVKNARSAYNRVTNVDQKKFITEEARLFAAEAAIRAARTALGETVTVSELRIKTSPNKLSYVAGEMFDATGMVLTVVYDDLSEEDVSTGFVLPTTPLTTGQQMVTFTYQGIEKQISLTVQAGNDPVTPPDSETTGPAETDPEAPDTTDPAAPGTDDPAPGGDSKTPVGLIVGLSVGGVVLVAAIVVAVLLIRKKKK